MLDKPLFGLAACNISVVAIFSPDWISRTYPKLPTTRKRIVNNRYFIITRAMVYSETSPINFSPVPAAHWTRFSSRTRSSRAGADKKF